MNQEHKIKNKMIVSIQVLTSFLLILVVVVVESFSLLPPSPIRLLQQQQQPLTTSTRRRIHSTSIVTLSSVKQQQQKDIQSQIILYASAVSKTTTSNTKSMEVLKDWSSLDPETLSPTKCLIEQTLCVQSEQFDTYQQPQLAKDYDYANAILEAWQQDEASTTTTDSTMWNTEWKSIKYYDTNNNNYKIPLYGHFIRKKKTSSSIVSTSTTVPPIGILLFHTGAGPHDIFLLWKASTIVNTIQQLSNENNDNNDNKMNENQSQSQSQQEQDVIVFIADMLSDECGWGWNDNRTHYKQVFDTVFGTVQEVVNNDIIDGSNNTVEKEEQDVVDDDDDKNLIVDPVRPVLQSRIDSAIQVLQKELSLIYTKEMSSTNSTIENNYNNNILFDLGAIGWCLGGHCILELSKMNLLSIKVMATFHGVFNAPTVNSISSSALNNNNNNNNTNDNTLPNNDDITTMIKEQQQRIKVKQQQQSKTQILISHGYDDKFVSNEDLQVALATFQKNHNIVSLLQLTNAKHGFSNPAQDYNKQHNANLFGYHDISATKAWKQTITLFRRCLFDCK